MNNYHVLCGAKLRGKQRRCMKPPLTGKTRCRLHGGLSTGPRSAAGKAAMVAASQAGRERWCETVRGLVAVGLIERFPCGRRRTATSVTAPLHPVAPHPSPLASLMRTLDQEAAILAAFDAAHAGDSGVAE